MLLQKIQNEIKGWTEKNFPHTTADEQLLGIVEEVGELSHAVLKQKQCIRGDKKKLIADEHDAIGDIAIFLINYCNQRGFDFEKILAVTWEQVHQRDWQANPADGGQQPVRLTKKADDVAAIIAEAAVRYIKAEWEADKVANDECIMSYEEDEAVEELWRSHEELEEVVSNAIDPLLIED